MHNYTLCPPDPPGKQLRLCDQKAICVVKLQYEGGFNILSGDSSHFVRLAVSGTVVYGQAGSAVQSTPTWSRPRELESYA